MWRYDELRSIGDKYARSLWWLGFGLGFVVGLTVAVLWRFV